MPDLPATFMGLPAFAFFSPDDYLAWEETHPERHEYVDGQVYAMTGATVKHNVLCLNVAMALRAALKGSPCRVLMTDVKLRVDQANAYYYPDVMVTCADTDNDPRIIREPRLIIEVLSESTEATDRREKLAAYRKLASLREYLLVAQDERKATLYRLNDNSVWELGVFEGNSEIELVSLDVKLTLDTIYERT